MKKSKHNKKKKRNKANKVSEPHIASLPKHNSTADKSDYEIAREIERQRARAQYNAVMREKALIRGEKYVENLKATGGESTISQKEKNEFIERKKKERAEEIRIRDAIEKRKLEAIAKNAERLNASKYQNSSNNSKQKQAKPIKIEKKKNKLNDMIELLALLIEVLLTKPLLLLFLFVVLTTIFSDGRSNSGYDCYESPRGIMCD